MDAAVITELAINFLIANVKFAVALGALMLSPSNFSYLEIVITLIAGGCSGVTIFYFFSNWINTKLSTLFSKKEKKKKKRKSTKGIRRFIKIKNKYGLVGISLLTPMIISIPVGSFLASRFFGKKKTTLWVMYAGVAFWAILFPLIKLYF